MAKKKLTKRQLDQIRQRKALLTNQPTSKTGDSTTGLNLIEGLVTSRLGQQIDVETTTEPTKKIRCHLRQNLDSIVTGDKVLFHYGDDGMGIVESVLTRKTVLGRPSERGNFRPIAANIDQIIIVIAPTPNAYAYFIDQYIVASEILDITPALLFNKTDLDSEGEKGTPRALIETYRALGYKTILSSTKLAEGTNCLQQQLEGYSSIFVGQSGVGKTSLINQLIPNLQEKTSHVSTATKKGTHTTTASRLYHLPSGGSVIDSPGVREFGLWKITEDNLNSGFKEFSDYINHCKFRNCQHTHEPGCALLSAIENGKITKERSESYFRIRENFCV